MSGSEGPRSSRVAAWGLLIYAGARVVAILLEQTSMAAAVAQAVVAEWGVGRLGVTWSDPDAPAPATSAIAKRAALGAAIGAAVAGGVVLFLKTTGAILVSRSTPAASVVVVSLVTAGLYAMRDELILHGVTLRALGSATPAVARVLACGITSAAAAIGDGSTPAAAASRGLLGLVFGALWVRDRGAWQPWGAHAAWLFTGDLLLRGGILDAQVAASRWGGAEAGPLGGYAAIVALLPFAAAAVARSARK